MISTSTPSALRHHALLAASPGSTNRKNMLLLVQLRWIAVLGQVVTIALVHIVLGIHLPLMAMMGLLLALVALNFASQWWVRHRTTVGIRALLYALMLDVLALTGQLYLSGGTANPFIGLYLLQVTLGAVLLNATLASGVTVMNSVSQWFEYGAELDGFRYTNRAWHHVAMLDAPDPSFALHALYLVER